MAEVSPRFETGSKIGIVAIQKPASAPAFLFPGAYNAEMAIVLFTDFGAGDLYVGQVKAVLQRLAPGIAVIDLLHDAPAFNVRASAHLLAAMVGCFAEGSVF